MTATETVRLLRHALRLRSRRFSDREQPRRRAAAGPALQIMIFTSEIAPVVSGIARSMGNLHRSLTARGHQVVVVSRADFARVVWRELRLSAFVFAWPSFRHRLNDYDVINVHGPVPSMSEAFLLLCATVRGHRPAIVYTHHSDLAIPGLERACGIYNGIMHRVARFADCVLVSSAEYARKFGSLGDTPIEIVPWGVQSQAKPRLQAQPAGAPLRALFVGQLRPYKGLHVLLDAVARAPEVRLTVIGGGSQLSELRARVAAERLDNVQLLGRVSDAELWDAYSSHDVVVLPSLTTAEAFGLVLVEGMAAGCVPVASDLPGVRGVPGPSGVLVPPGDARALRSALLGLAQDRDGLAERAAQCVRRAESMSIEATAAMHEAAFRRTVERVVAREAAAVLPAGWQSPRELLDAMADFLHTDLVSIALVELGARPTPTVIWRRNGDLLRSMDAPLITHVARQGRAVVIDPTRRPDPQVVPLLHRPELTSAIVTPVCTAGRRISVLSVSTTRAQPAALRYRQLGGILTLLDERKPLAA